MDDIFSNPLEHVKQMWQTDPTLINRLTEVGSHFKSNLNGKENRIPSINQVSFKDLPNGTLVRFQGMVQDMLDPEFFLGMYHVTNTTTNQIEKRFNCYSDNIALHENIEYDHSENLTLERQTLYCVPVPGENQWVKKKLNEYPDFTIASDNKGSRKRGFENSNGDEEMDCSEKKTKQENGNEGKPKLDESKETFDPNHPLPNGTGQTCFVILYSDMTELKINEVAEFICLIDSNNTKENQSEPQSEQIIVNDSDQIMMEPSTGVQSYIHKLPRLHCLYFNKVSTLNPEIINKTSIYEKSLTEISNIRNELMTLLTQMFEGDAIAAEYLLLHLISSTYAIVGVLCVGKMSLNISNIKTTGFTTKLYRFLENIVEKSFYLPLTIDNLNKLKYTPKKDYEANRLTSGLLQLSADTNLVLDETKMEPGKLDAGGLENLKSLGNLIQWQNVAYDFQFSKVEMKTNVNVMVLSEGKSMLTCDCQINMKPNKSDEDEKGTLAAMLEDVDDKVLEKIRIYLSFVKSVEYNLAEEVAKALEDDFVEMRKVDSKSASAESFSLLLTTARFMALSYGQGTLDAALWTRTKNLDAERRSRLKS